MKTTRYSLQKHGYVSIPLSLSLPARSHLRDRICNVQIPIVVIIVFLTFVVVFAWFKQSFRKAFAIFRVYDAHTGSNPAASAGRELTAEQLAGSDTAINLPTTRAPRRTRRPRRTPSQVSVTSLPAYNKEPGDEELVIFR